MKERVDSLLQELAVDLAQHGFDTAFVNRGVERMQALAIETEDDRRERIAGLLRFIDFLLAHAPSNVIEALENNRRTLQVQFDRSYGRPDAPYLATNAIVERLQQGLRRGERCEDLVARAAADLEYVAFDGSPEDSAIKIGGTLRIQALHAVYNWLATGEHDFSSAPPILALVAPVETMFRQGRLDPSLVVETADAIHAHSAESAEDREARVSMQMLVMGLGLWSRPDAAPTFEPIRDRLAELFAMDQTEARSDAVLRDYAARLERDGFSEYAFRETTAALQDLSSETAEDAEAIHAAVLKMFDMSIP